MDALLTIFITIVSIVVLASVLVNAYALWRQLQIAKATVFVPEALRDRIEVTKIQLISSMFISSIVVNSIVFQSTGTRILTPPESLLVLGIGLAIKIVPSVRWLIRLRNGDFDDSRRRTTD